MNNMKQPQYDILIKDVRRIKLPADIAVPCALAIRDGAVAAILPPDGGNATAETVIEGGGKYIIPGLIDLHVHFREPGFEYKEDIASGSKCAAAGGVTSVFTMPNTKPACDSPEVLSYIYDKAKNADCRVFQLAAITKGLESREVTDLPALAEAGAAAFSDDGKPVMTAKLLREAMKIAAEHDYLIMSHCEDMSLAEGGAINEGKVARMLGLGGISNLSESLAVERDIMVAEDTGCRLHICHVSTKESIDCIRRAKARGVKVTAETCPHYFTLTDEDVIFYGGNAKMNPPLRSAADVKAVIEALADGTLDCISTDHAPHSADEKNKHVSKALNGIIGLQTSFIASYTALVVPGYITFAKLLELMAVNPAKITRLDEKGLGNLEVGSPADFALITLGCENTVTRESLRGKSTNTPFAGMTFAAKVEATYVGGRRTF